MPRRKRHDAISTYHLGLIEKEAGALRRTMVDATMSLTPFRAHYDAIGDLEKQIDRALNILNDRDPDWLPPGRRMPS